MAIVRLHVLYAFLSYSIWSDDKLTGWVSLALETSYICDGTLANLKD